MLVWIATHRVVVHLNVEPIIANHRPKPLGYIFSLTFSTINRPVDMQGSSLARELRVGRSVREQNTNRAEQCQNCVRSCHCSLPVEKHVSAWRHAQPQKLTVAHGHITLITQRTRLLIGRDILWR